MKRIFTISTLALFCIAGFAQTITLTFTGRDSNNRRVQLDRVVITNLTRSWQETITWPDTTLTIQNGVGIVENGTNGVFSLSQNTPNPFDGTTNVNLTVAEFGTITMELADGNGRIVGTQNFASLQCGTHQFHITAANAGTYFLTARQNGQTSSVKMVNNGNGGANSIEYVGNLAEPLHATALQQKSAAKGNTNKPFAFGDQMEYVGYATINGNEEESAHITQSQGFSQTFPLQFSASIPTPMDDYSCPGMPTITDIDGNTYNTVLIGTQCWMKENLRTTTYADKTPIDHGTTYSLSIAYWYYPGNDAGHKEAYGLLYNWKAVMRDATSSSHNPSGVQGICPTGWHVPSDNEWKQLEVTVGVSQSDVDSTGWRGNIAAKLCSNIGWSSSSTTDAAGNPNASGRNSTGFSVLPAGCYGSGFYVDFRNGTSFWSATEFDSTQVYYRYLNYDYATVNRRYVLNKSDGYSVRCVRD